MYKISYTSQFKKDYKKAKKRNYNFAIFEQAYTLLEKKGELPARFKPHLLQGNYKGIWDAHLKPDWLILYNVNHVVKEVVFVRMGSHSDLFK